jgi:hypothetical protein
MTYRLVKNPFNGRKDVVNKMMEGGLMLSIPFDPDNTDAQQFAKWLQEGNKPAPAEEGGVVTDEWVAETIAKLLP